MWTMSSHSQPIGTVWGSRFNTHESLHCLLPIALPIYWHGSQTHPALEHAWGSTFCPNLFTDYPSTSTSTCTWWSIQSFQDLLEFSGSELLCARRPSRNWRGHDDGTSTHRAHSTSSTQHTTRSTAHRARTQRTAHRAHRTAHCTQHSTQRTAHRTQRTQQIAQALPAGAWQRFELRNTFRKYVHTHIVIAHKHKDTSNYKQNCVCKRYKSTSASWMLYIKNTWKGPKLRVKFAPKLS